MRRVVVYASSTLADLLSPGEHHYTTDGLPVGARLVDAFWDSSRALLGLVFEHESFEDVFMGTAFPERHVFLHPIKSEEKAS